jgi:AcrR family transcriptional regulator
LSRADTRARLLDAAVAVVRRDGAQSLTLDAVAAQAGVSKGGLLYHFKSKRELLEGMVERWLAEWQEQIDRESGDAGFLTGYVHATHLGGAGPEEREAEFGLLAALIADPAVIEVVRARYEDWQAQAVRDAPDPVAATVARLATDGLWLADLLGFAPPRGELREQVLARLLELARPCPPPSR